MENYQLIDFINQNLKKGLTENKTRQFLLNEGWSMEQINDGFRLIEFIKKNLREGFSEKEIRQSLLENDWTEEQVSAGFRLVTNQANEKPSSKILFSLSILFFLVVFALVAYFSFEYFKINSQIYNEIEIPNEVQIESPSPTANIEIINTPETVIDKGTTDINPEGADLQQQVTPIENSSTP